MKQTLYTISEEVQALEEMMMADGGEITESFEELSGFIEETLSAKTDGCVDWINSIEDDIIAAKSRISELRDFIESRKNAIENFKKYIEICMERTGKEKFVGQFYSIKKRKPSKVLLIKDESSIPLEYLQEERKIKIDKKGLLKHLKTGEKVEGCEIVEGKASLSMGIKSKKD